MRKILHLDLDAFYPSVEALDAPEIAGHAVIVGGLGRRGVVASASYEARKHGVRSAMPMAKARRLCPEGIYLRPRFERYRELSNSIFEIYRHWTPDVQPLSVDEAFLDVDKCAEPPVQVARAIKRSVLDETSLTVSAGVSHNKFLAKLASGHEKPDGLTVVSPLDVRDFLDPLPLDRLWGVGPSTANKLKHAGFLTIGDIAVADTEQMKILLGKLGPQIIRLAQGNDPRPVRQPGNPKTISAEVTFDNDISSWREAAPHIQRFAARIEGQLTKRDLWARTVTLKARYTNFHTVTRSETPSVALRSKQQLLDTARSLARRVPLSAKQRVRLVGLGVQNIATRTQLESGTGSRQSQLSLFEFP